MFGSFRSITLTMWLIAGVLGAPVFSALGEENPSFWVESETIDAGKVIAGRTASVTYVFHNDGPTDITILRASPS